MNLPPINFSNWTRWTDRREIVGYKTPGVYALAHFNEEPNTVDLQSQEIIYIGETCDQSLDKRWGQFERSAFAPEEKKEHSGGE
ncbi:MAG TPA: hypothetical protein VMX94_12090, partial [Armatimonadota bacterium]|nr:hypothetical protein [Armatimonadota bacterium]